MKKLSSKKLLAACMAALMLLLVVPAGAIGRVPDETRASLYGAGEGLTLFPSELELPLFSTSSGEKLRVMYNGAVLSPYEFDWSTSDPTVCEVTQSGSLIAKAPGTAVVSVTDGDETAEAIVTVVEDEGFATVATLDMTEIDLPYYSAEVGIGPLGGAQPVILKRFIRAPGCGSDPQPDPNDYITTEGWTYSYAVVYKFRVHNLQTIRFETSASTGEGPHASSAYICVYDPFFNLWTYNSGTNADPYGRLTVTFYEDGYFYLAITPKNHINDDESGFITLYVYDETQPFGMGDVDMDHYVTCTDALLVFRFTMGLIELGAGAELADVSNNGSVGSDDALIILRQAMGL